MSESIYQLIPVAEAVREKAPLYRSKHDPRTPPTGALFGAATATVTGEANRGGDARGGEKHKHAAATMGRKTGETPRLHRSAKGPAELPAPQRFVYSDRRKAPVEKTSRVKKAPAAPRKDFVRTNKTAAVETAKAARAKKAAAAAAATKRADYGKAPAYLEKVKKVVAEEQEIVRQMVEGRQKQEEAAAGPRVRLLGDDERAELLGALKTKWDEVNRGYQQMTHLVTLDTLSQVKKKENFETQLAELEKAMDKLGKQHVFVADE